MRVGGRGAGLPFWLRGRVCGPSCLRLPRRETSAGEEAVKECGTRRRRVRRWASADKQQPSAPAPRVSRRHAGSGGMGVQQACGRGEWRVGTPVDGGGCIKRRR